MAYNTKNIIRDASGAPIPQFYNPTPDAYQPLTGVDLGGGRYGYDSLIWGKTAGGLYIPVKVADDGTINAQLTGRKVEYENILIFNALAITNTVDYMSSLINISSFEWYLEIINTHDQDILLHLKYIDNKLLIPASGTPVGLTIPKSGLSYLGRLYTKNDYAPIGAPFASLYFKVSASIAPTTGSITIRLIGRR